MNLDSKKDWKSKKMELYQRIQDSPYLTDKIKKRVYDYSGGIWETPKVYIDGYAYNDGSWIIYNTFRMKDGKRHNKVFCKSKKDMINQLYSYMCFLKNIGINTTLELGYFTVCHIISKLSFNEGMFPNSIDNMACIEGIIKTVQKNDVSCSRKDTRKYCMDPKMKEGKTRGQKVGLQRKKDKEVTWKRIEELYDEELTNRQNLDKMKEAGLDISEATLQRWKRTHRGCQMDFGDRNSDDKLY